MGVADRTRERTELHFSEGEPDLEPPEELAIGELGEDAILEEELDNEDVLEQDVDEDTIEVTLEDLVHDGDEDEDEVDEAGRPVPIVPAGSTRAGRRGDRDEDQDDVDVEPDESLDVVLLDRLALLEPEPVADDDDEPEGSGRAVLLLQRADPADPGDVAPCGSDEFVCRGCFLVRNRVQLADPGVMVCRDCAT